jgi:hypothetical protein
MGEKLKNPGMYAEVVGESQVDLRVFKYKIC